MKKIILIVTLLVLGAFGISAAQSAAMPLEPGQYEFYCGTGRLRHSFINNNVNYVRLTCTTNGEGVPTATPTATAIPLPTNTPVPPTATPMPIPTATPNPGNETPVAGQECPTWVHDSHVTLGPDGKTYPTWHPPVDEQFGCWFNHEHGDDPRTAQFDPSMPAFGYEAALMGMNEGHVGFKVGVANAGEVNNEGRTILRSYKTVYHMGTANPNRFSVRFHTMTMKLWEPNGTLLMDVKGMADTGGADSICANPRQGKTVMTLPNQTNCQIDSPYEIWEFKLNFEGRGQAIMSGAAFDPITIMDRANPQNTVYGWNAWPQFIDESARGCDREFYGGPFYLYNSGNSAEFWTDHMGNEVAPSTPGSIRQFIAPVTMPEVYGIALAMSRYPGENPPLTQGKVIRNYCVPNLGAN